MADISKLFRTGYGVRINYIINTPQSIANNTTSVTVKAQLYSDGSSYTINSSATKNGTLSINGKDYSFTFSASLSGNQIKTLYTKTLDIPHSSDGTKTLSLGISLGINVTLSGTYWGTVTHSGSVTLPTIPRTSSMSLSTTSATLGSTSVTVTINRASADFTHKVYCKIGSYSVQVNSGSEGSVSIPFTPELTIANQITSSTSGSATIEVQTWSAGAKLGSVTKSLTVNVPSSMVPTINSFTATPVAAGAATTYGYVKGLSKCNLAIGTVTNSYGATIDSYSISGGGFSSTTSSLATGNLNNAGAITFTAKVTDTRGRTDTATVSITVYDYSVPSISAFSARRCNSLGTILDDGTYLSVLATYSFSSVNSQNTVTTSVQYKKSTTTTWATGVAVTSGAAKVIGGGLVTADSSFDVIITVADKFNSVTKTVVVPTAYAVIDILKGGKGMSIGKIAETSNLLDVNMDIKARQNLSLTGNLNVSFGNVNSETGRTAARGELYTYNTISTNTGAPVSYGSIIGFGRGTAGTVEICGEWTSGRGLWVRSLRDTTDNWYGWSKIYTEINKPTPAEIGAYAKSEWDSSNATNGYCKLPTGVIMQWGAVTITPSAAGVITSSVITFPITFPSGAKSINVTPNSAVPDKLTTSGGTITSSGFTIYMTRTNTTDTTVWWFATGY